MNGRLQNWLEGNAVYFLMELALVSALAVMLAHWTWTFAAPATLAAPARTVAAGSAKIDVPRGIFGSADVAAEAQSVAANMRLVGVSSGDNGVGSRAMFKAQGGTPLIVRAGDVVTPGVFLKEVHPDHVVLERSGALERLKLDRRAVRVPERPAAR